MDVYWRMLGEGLGCELLGGKMSPAAGFVRRMMYENSLKHDGQYKKPTDPAHKDSTMKKWNAFDYKKLANASQDGVNKAGKNRWGQDKTAAYGASPFIIKHFKGATVAREAPKETVEQSRARYAAISRRYARMAAAPGAAAPASVEPERSVRDENPPEPPEPPRPPPTPRPATPIPEPIPEPPTRAERTPGAPRAEMTDEDRERKAARDKEMKERRAALARSAETPPPAAPAENKEDAKKAAKEKAMKQRDAILARNAAKEAEEAAKKAEEDAKKAEEDAKKAAKEAEEAAKKAAAAAKKKKLPDDQLLDAAKLQSDFGGSNYKDKDGKDTYLFSLFTAPKTKNKYLTIYEPKDYLEKDFQEYGGYIQFTYERIDPYTGAPSDGELLMSSLARGEDKEEVEGSGSTGIYGYDGDDGKFIPVDDLNTEEAKEARHEILKEVRRNLRKAETPAARKARYAALEAARKETPYYKALEEEQRKAREESAREWEIEKAARASGSPPSAKLIEDREGRLEAYKEFIPRATYDRLMRAPKTRDWYNEAGEVFNTAFRKYTGRGVAGGGDSADFPRMCGI